MVKAGIVKSYHGGSERGYCLNRDAEAISLYEVIDLFEGWSTSRSRPHSAKDDFHCIGVACIDTIEERMLSPLKKITFGLLAREDHEREVERLVGR
jgi:DNA-binding IscR family transcriptional regulator